MGPGKQIEGTLQCLIGCSFWGAGRVANLLTFQFGPRQVRTNLRGELYEVGTYAFHVQCAWHLANAHHLLVASGDLNYEPSETLAFEGDVYTWAQAESSLLDERLLQFFQQCKKMPIFVQAIRADDLGGVAIELSQDHTLSVFPDTSLEAEYWRFFQLGSDLPHFIMTDQGIEGPEE